MTRHALTLVLLLASATAQGADGTVVSLTPDDVAAHPAFCVAAEMTFIPEADTWEAVAEGATPAEEADAFKAAWQKEAGWAAKHLTPELTRALSRWAKPQMEKYAAVPSVEKLAFAPVRSHDRRSMVVYQTIIDDKLPTHSALVHRQLIAYALYSVEEKRIVRLTVTIRGWREE